MGHFGAPLLTDATPTWVEVSEGNENNINQLIALINPITVEREIKCPKKFARIDFNLFFK